MLDRRECYYETRDNEENIDTEIAATDRNTGVVKDDCENSYSSKPLDMGQRYRIFRVHLKLTVVPGAKPIVSCSRALKGSFSERRGLAFVAVSPMWPLGGNQSVGVFVCIWLIMSSATEKGNVKCECDQRVRNVHK